MRLLPALLAATLLAGCVRRQVDISSLPEGALVRVNDREVGRTPCRVEFDHYGDYSVRLTLEGYETVVGVGNAKAPAWDWAGADLVGELMPIDLVSSHRWVFHLVPSRDDPDALVDRAAALRSDLLALESESPVDRAPLAPPDEAKSARDAGERGVVPTPPSVLEPPVGSSASPSPAPSSMEPAPMPGAAPPTGRPN